MCQATVFKLHTSLVSSLPTFSKYWLVTFHLFFTLRLPIWHHWTKTSGLTGSRLEEAIKYLTSLLRQGVKFCCVHVSLGQHRTPKLYHSGYSVCWWMRSSGWQGPSLQTLPSSKSKRLTFFIWKPCSIVQWWFTLYSQNWNSNEWHVLEVLLFLESSEMVDVYKMVYNIYIFVLSLVRQDKKKKKNPLGLS